MKVKIGPYLNWIGPYQIADKIFFWHESYPGPELEKRWDYRLHDRFGDWLADTWVANFCQWIYDRRKRTIKIKIDHYDVWSADYTLALIILPILKQLKIQKQGYGWVDDEDVPEELRTVKKRKTRKAVKDLGLTVHSVDFGDEESIIHKKWDWVLNEMIWSFEQMIKDDDQGEFFDHSVSKGMPWDKDYVGPQVDWDGLRAHQARKANGFRLFGKYYEGLWD